MILGETPGEAIASWTVLWLLLAAFAAIVVTLLVIGRRVTGGGDALLWIPRGLERVTGIPGWAAAMVGTAAFGLLVAGIGFYNDVAWHVGRGRDKELFTAPHTMILIGLGTITLAAGIGIFLATLDRVDTELRFSALRIPWSAVPLGVLGICAVSGFPLDELWHEAYGIDVTMWSPTHMLMICGAAFSLIAAWLALSEAGVAFRESVWSRVAHFIAAWFVLQGLTAPLGEFRFGVPQFQQLYHPLLLALAAAFAFVPTRIVLGRGWSLAVAAAVFLPEALDFGSGSAASDFVPTRAVGAYLGAALAVELVALAVGIERRLRFAILSGLAVGTIGLAGEWAWNGSWSLSNGAPQPWGGALWPDALFVAVLVAVGAAILGAAYGGAVARQPGRLPRAAVIAGAVIVLVALLLPLPRRTGDVQVAIDLTPAEASTANVAVRLEPTDAAADARWFQVIAWQGGGFRHVDLRQTEPGVYVSEGSIPIGGEWKTMLRLHRGDELMSAPIYLPADPEIGAPEIPAEDRTTTFGSEEQYLMREVKEGPDTVKILAYAIVTGVSVLWAAAFVIACVRIPGRPPLRPTAEGRRPRDPVPVS